MRISSLAVVTALAMASTVLAQPPAPTTRPQADVPVKVVVLFSSGVGYFEHAGQIAGNASTELRFKTGQINDILKSLVVEDESASGRVTGVVYPSQDPLAKTLRSFQIDITSNPSLAELLNQLRGAKVKVAFATETLSGTILGLEKKPKAIGEKGSIEVWVLNLISGGVIRALELEQVTKLELEDKALEEELTKALTALAQARDQDKKPVTINFTGEGQRPVKIGYVVETPIWKSSYRLVLPQKAGDKAALQGWAIVENQTDNDWNNIRLALVSGRPISFVQELYSPLYIPRPVVQPDLFASLKPQEYEGGFGATGPALASREAQRKGEGMEMEKAAATPPAMAGAGPGRAKQQQNQAGDLLRRAGGEAHEDYTRDAMERTKSVQSIASAAKVGEYVQYTVPAVTLPRQRSAMLPIITENVEVERVSIYNSSVLPRNPLNGARLKNTSKDHLLAGPITVFEDQAYGGDARIDNVPPGQERLLSYGIDLQMLVDATKNKTASAIVTGSIVKGILQITNKYEYSQDYAAENKSDRNKVLIVEHPRRGAEVKLVSPAKEDEKTDAVYRFRLPVPAGKPATLTVKEEQVGPQTIAILGADVGQLEFYTRSGAIPQSVKDALAEVIKRKSALADTVRQIQQLEKQRTDIVNEQQRIRANMGTVDKNTPFYTRLVTKLNDQETVLEDIARKLDTLQEKRTAQQKELEDYVLNLNVDNK